jgi:cytoskeletal protein CcmA (bactofilin family)
MHSTGAVFEGEVEIEAGGGVNIRSDGSSIGAVFYEDVCIEFNDLDNFLTISGSTFEGDLEADGGDGTDTFTDGGGNVFLEDFDLDNFEVELP